MNTKLILAGALGLSAIFSGGYVLGQGAGKVSTATVLADHDEAELQMLKYTGSVLLSDALDAEVRAKSQQEAKSLANAPAQYAAVKAAAMRDPSATSFLLGKQIAKYKISRTEARSAPQISQVANEATVELLVLQAAQNQRIIELLEQMNAKKK